MNLTSGGQTDEGQAPDDGHRLRRPGLDRPWRAERSARPVRQPRLRGIRCHHLGHQLVWHRPVPQQPAAGVPQRDPLGHLPAARGHTAKPRPPLRGHRAGPRARGEGALLLPPARGGLCALRRPRVLPKAPGVLVADALRDVPDGGLAPVQLPRGARAHALARG